ncbi:hypothetical protein TWF679_010854 [Orbilia oligospora]|uniref:Uncharacterized protein n=1 Tax=Orbilia oligospora TaxID=2813651 RepID=A0A8H8UZ98_ORBOL|nr:hypothetical protein TWF679_010854 [Orbilia oligospora]
MNRPQRRDVRDRLPQVVEKRAPIQTITVDSEEFDRITRNWVGLENLAGITNTIGHATTLSTVPRAKSSSSLQSQLETTPTLTVKTPESKPALPIAEPVTRTVVTIGFTQPITSPHPYSTSKPAAHQGTATTSVVHQTQSSAHSKPDDQHHDHVAGIVVGLVAAGITSAIVLLVGLFFFCRYRRRRELAKGEEGEVGRKSGSFGRGAKRSASQNSAESKRKLLARTTTREQNDGGSEDEHWKPDEKVHYPPYQHIPRNLGSDLAANSDDCDRTSRAVSPSSADTPLPELPIRPPTEIRNTAPRHRPSLPIELRPFTASTRPVVGLTRPQTAYGNNGPGRYIMSPKAQSGCAVRRSSTKTHKKKSQAPSGSPRGRAYTLNTVESPERLAPLARNNDMFSSSSRSHSHSPTPGLNRRASTSSQRHSDANTPRGISRVASSNSLREDASGIPTVWMNGAESPKASPTRVRVDGASGPPPDFQVPPVFPISRRSGKLQIAIPESPIDGTIKSVSSTNSSILDTFKRSSGPLPIPEKSPLRPISPGYSIKSNSSLLARSPSPCPTDDSTEPETPGRVRRRNTGYRSPRRPSGSPPPALPTPTIALPQDDLRDDNSVTETITDESRSHNTMSLGTWSQITSTANTRPHSYSTNTTMSRLSLGMKEKVNTRFSASPIYESRDSGEIAASSRDSFLPTSDSHVKHQSCADQAVDSFFHTSRSGTNINRLSLEDIEYIEPELARCISITSTSGSCRTTIEFKPSTESLHSRMLSRSTIRTNDMRLEDIDLETCTDIEDVTATFTRSNSIASGYTSRYGRPSRLGDTTDGIDVDINNSVISSTYSPTLSMYNFYSSGSARYSTSVAPPSSRSPIAARRNSIVPNISIPQPQLYSHPSAQLEIDDVEELALTSGSLTSAISPLSFTTANSSEVSYSPPLDADIGAPIPLNAAVPIPTPQIYSSSQEDLSQMHINPTFKRRGSYMSFHPDQSYCDLNSALSHATGPVLLGKPSQNSLAVDSLFGGRFDTHGLGRNMSAGTLSTLDMSSFRDLDTDKSISSGLLESSSDESGNNAMDSMASDSSESDASSVGEKRRSRSLGALTTLKRKRSTVVKDVRGRSRERRLV